MGEELRQGVPRFDAANECVHWGDRRMPLTPKAFDVLRCLLAREGQIVTKREILDQVWPETHVTEAVLTVAIGQLRSALDDDSREPRFIETVHRRGYRWIGRFAPAEPDRVDAICRTIPNSQSSLLVGRVDALNTLEQALARASAGQRQLVFVTGEAGVGKTTLVDAFVTTVARSRSDVRIGRGQCVDTYGAGEPYMPILEAFEGLVRASGGEGLVDNLQRYAPTWLVQMPGVLPANEMDALRQSLAASTSTRMIREFLRLGEVVSAAAPMLLVIEDLHWADHATIALLSALASRREPARLLVLATMRPDDATTLQHPAASMMRELEAKRLCVAAAIAGLDASDVDTYVAKRFSPNDFPRGFSHALWQQTGGNPLFLTNAVDDLEQRGWLRQEADRWECTVTPAEIRLAVPGGTLKMIEARMERLSPADLELIGNASVIGRVFATQALAAITGRDHGEIEEQCARMARTGQFLQAGIAVQWPDGSVGREFVFRHALYEQVLYEHVPHARRVELHHRIAERIEAGYGDGAREVAAQLAHHFEHGGDARAAVRQYHRGARVALDRFAIHDAIAQLRRALALLATLPSTPESEAEELAMLGTLITVLYSEGPNPSEVALIADRIQSLAGSGATTIEVFQALVAQMVCHAALAELPRAHAVSEQIIVRASQLDNWGDIIARAACLGEGSYLYLRGDPAAGLSSLERAFELPSLAGLAVVEPSVGAQAEAAICHCLLGSPRQAIEVMRAAYARAEVVQHPATLAYVASAALRLGVLIQNRDLVATMTAVITEIAQRSQVARWNGLAQIGDGWTRHFDGDDTAADLVRAGRQQLLDLSYRLYEPFYHLMEATVLTGRGAIGMADDVIENALLVAEQSDERWCEAELYRLRAECLLATAAATPTSSRKRTSGNAQAIEMNLRRALEIAHSQRAIWWELRAARSLAQHFERNGRHDEASATLASVEPRFPEDAHLDDIRAAVGLIRPSRV